MVCDRVLALHAQIPNLYLLVMKERERRGGKRKGGRERGRERERETFLLV